MELAGLLCILTCQKGNGRSVNVRWRELDGTHGLTQHVSGFAFPRDVTHAGIMRITFQSLRLTAELSALESNILGEIFSCERSYATLWIIIGRPFVVGIISGKPLQAKEA